MTSIWPFSRDIHRSSVACIIPARGMTPAERSALEGTMQSLVLQGSALALEIASTQADTHQARRVQFLLRARSEDVLHAATRQIQVRYPQAIVHHIPPEEDPFEVGTHAFVSAMELRAGGAAYETLRSWSPGKPHEQGIDPLVGVLATLEHLPAGMRAVIQLALTPLPPTWARTYQRLSVENPLEEEREQRREAQARLRRGAPGWEQILLLGIVVVLLVGWNYAQAHHLLPPWLQEDVLSLLHGSLPHLSSFQEAIVGVGLVVVIMLIAVLTRGIRWLGEHVFRGTEARRERTLPASQAGHTPGTRTPTLAPGSGRLPTQGTGGSRSPSTDRAAYPDVRAARERADHPTRDPLTTPCQRERASAPTGAGTQYLEPRAAGPYTMARGHHGICTERRDVALKHAFLPDARHL